MKISSVAVIGKPLEGKQIVLRSLVAIGIDMVSDVTINDLVDASYKHDLIISISAPIITPDMLKKLKCPIVNVHTAPLPKYRGSATDSWMILNGDDGIVQHGHTHMLTSKIDGGDIVATASYIVPPNAVPIQIHAARMGCIPELIRNTIFNMSDPDFLPTPQNEKSAIYYPRLDTAIDGGIDWSWPAYYIDRHVRAFKDPYPGAWTKCDGVMIRILNGLVYPFDRKLPLGMAGYVYGVDGLGECEYHKYGARVACGDGSYIVTKVKLEGGSEEWGRNVLRVGRRLT